MLIRSTLWSSCYGRRMCTMHTAYRNMQPSNPSPHAHICAYYKLLRPRGMLQFASYPVMHAPHVCRPGSLSACKQVGAPMTGRPMYPTT
jgi:hypothetical protein